MNACIADFEPAKVAREIPGREVSWVNALLSQWGAWIWENRDFEGYPSSDPITSFINGAGGSRPGHRIICRDMPKAVTLTHVLWLMLPEHEGVAVYAEYVPGVSETGLMWTRAQKCQVLKLSEEAFRKRLQRARIRIWEWSEQRRRN
jgi:hypothetical protein